MAQRAGGYGVGLIRTGAARAFASNAGRFLAAGPVTSGVVRAAREPTHAVWRPVVVADELRQPDATTCGSCAVVMARLINDSRFRAGFLDADGVVEGSTFAAAALRAHRDASGFRDHRGRPQLPWVPMLGTLPWAVARAMSGSGGGGTSGTRYRVVPFDPDALPTGVDAVVSAVDAGECVPLFVGTSVMARHVMLATGVNGEGIEYYDPADGRWHHVSTVDLGERRASIAGWHEPRFAILPAGHR